MRHFIKDKRIVFNLITTGSKCKTVMEYINSDEDFKNCIKNVCVYCMNLEKYQNLKEIYPNIHDDIYNKRNDVINFINKYSSENIKPFPITKLITFEEYKEKYKDRHLKISEFYGDFEPKNYEKSFKYISSLINEESKSKELKKNKDDLMKSLTAFDFKNEQDINALDKLIIKEYTKNTFYGDLNKWLLNYKSDFYEAVAYFTARLMYSLNSYAKSKKMFYKENDKTLYRGTKISYSNLVPYERAKGKIILLSAFTSTSESKDIALKFSGRGNSEELYNANLLFSVLFIIKNKWKKPWVPNGINIQNESAYKKEKEILYQPFSFYLVKDVNIDYNKYTADIYLETIGKTEILEEKIKKKEEIIYNKSSNIIEIKKK